MPDLKTAQAALRATLEQIKRRDEEELIGHLEQVFAEFETFQKECSVLRAENRSLQEEVNGLKKELAAFRGKAQ